MSKDQLPINHLAVIMDGNRRWAKAHNLPAFAGHREGVSSLKELAYYCLEQNIKYLTAYAFSTENWLRTQNEITFLFDLLRKVLQTELPNFMEHKIRLRFWGDLQGIQANLVATIHQIEKQTATNHKLNLQIAFNYSSRQEIVQAIKKVVQSGLSPEELNEKTFAQYLYSAGTPDPDLLIRTSGECRLSNYLLWQLAYSEIIFCPVLWPDFREEQVKACIEEFRARDRRFGK